MFRILTLHNPYVRFIAIVALIAEAGEHTVYNDGFSIGGLLVALLFLFVALLIYVDHEKDSI